MTDDHSTDRAALRGSRSALVRYVAGWLLAGALVAALAIVVLGDVSDDDASLPPVRQTALHEAVRRAGCELRRVDGREATRPRVSGPAATRAAPPRVYDAAPPVGELVAAMRRGVIVIHYREGIDGSIRERLETLQRVLPTGTIVTPDRSRMRYEIAITGYRRLLGCRRATAGVFDAMRLFRGRFVGLGPDRDR